MKTPKLTIKQIATIALYAQEWAQGSEGQEYRLGGYETAGHLLACLMVQNLSLDCMDTADGVRLLLGSRNGADKKELEKKIRAYMKQVDKMNG